MTWIKKSKLTELVQLVKDTAATSTRSIEAVQVSLKQVEQLAILNSRLLALVKDAPDFAIIISQANDDAMRATAMREHSEFVESLLRLFVCQ